MSVFATAKAKLLDVAGSPNLLKQREFVRSIGRYPAGIKVRLSKVRNEGYVPGLLSIIVPVYNVEEYLAETLDSLIRQAYRFIEIIVVDDGSPDRSINVARRFALIDPRVVIVRRPNGGLGAARKTGLANARGEFVTFMDSDDTVQRNAYAPLIASLQRTGSDFAVAPYRRILGTEYPAAAFWIREAHRDERESCALTDFPDIMVNSMACSKVFRRAFWDSAELTFREDIQFEDQVMTARAYSLATSFDVMTEVGLNWRIRDDGTSITQQLSSAKSIRDLTTSMTEVAEILEAHSTAEVREQRLIQILSNDLSHFLPNIPEYSDEAWEAIRNAVETASRLVRFDTTWNALPARSKIVYELIRKDDREAAEVFLREGGWNKKDFKTHISGTAVIGELPLWETSLSQTPQLFELALRDTRLRTSTSTVNWKEPGVLEIQGIAYIHNVDQGVFPRTVTASLVAHSSGARNEVQIVPTEVDGENLPTNMNPTCSPYSVGFKAEVPVTGLAGHPDTYTIEISVNVGDVKRTSDLHLASRMVQLSSHIDENGVAIEVVRDNARRFTLRSYPVRAVLRRMERVSDTLSLSVTGQDLFEVGLIRDDDRFNSVQHSSQLRSAGSNESTWLGSVSLPRLRQGEHGQRKWRLVAKSRRHGWLPVIAPELSPSAISDEKLPLTSVSKSRGSEYRSTVSATRGLVEHIIPAQSVLVTQARFRAIATELSFSEATATLTMVVSVAGGNSAAVNLYAASTRSRFCFERMSSRRFNLNMSQEAFQRGTYSVIAELDDGNQTAVELDFSVLDSQVTYRSSINRIRLRQTAKSELKIQVLRPLESEALGSYAQVKLRSAFTELPVSAPASSFLFRSLYGDHASDSALAIHHEIVRRNLDIDLVWVVSDYTKRVPAGSRTVIEDSPEFHKAMATSSVLVFNIHQPDWWEKRPGQVVVETLHGYPFKLAGRPWWHRTNLSPARIESYDKRARDWDILVSPAPYATPFLREGFIPPEGFKGHIAEVGYPRNDALLSPARMQHRMQVRRELKIGGDKKVVLYAPTFRDYLSRDDYSAPMVDFVDFSQLTRKLGSEYVFLMRGHAFNARHAGEVPPENVIDVTAHSDLVGLCLASDAAVLDYSSLRFDYALTDKPMIFHVPDRQKYFDVRPSLVPYRDTAPGPHTETNAELIGQLRDLDEVDRNYHRARARFRDAFTPLDDGKAASRLLDDILATAKNQS